MKIIYIVPGIMDPEEVKRRGSLLKEWAFPGTETGIVAVTEGPASVESMYEEYLSIPAAAKAVYRHEQEGWDAAIVGCAGDTGLDGMREITNKMVVVGPGQASMITAAMLGHRFSVLTIEDSMIESSYELAYKAGVLQKLASVRAVNIPVLELSQNRENSLNTIISAGREAVEQDRADCLILGCMTMGFLNVAEEIQEKLQIPVINPSRNCLKIAEMLVGTGLTHSKKAFATPPKLSSGRVSNLDELYRGPKGT